MSKYKNEIELKLFFELDSPESVANLLDVNYKHLIYYLYRLPEEKKYLRFNICKKNGQNRIIMAPATPLKLIQRKLSDILYHVYNPKPNVHGFVYNRSIVSNANKHIKKNHVLNIDILDFFPTINFGRVRGMFLKKPYELPEKVATVLAQICCYDNQLPQGAPTSPIISNMICSRLDNQLLKISKKKKCFYTRYADDITFSTKMKKFPEEIATIDDSEGYEKVILGKVLENIINNNGFSINQNKIRLQKRQVRQTVTGITVNEFANLQRNYTNQIRAMLYAWEKFGLDNAEKDFLDKHDKKYRAEFKDKPKFKQVVRGKINYLKMVRGVDSPVFIKYAKKLAQLDKDYDIIFKEKIEPIIKMKDLSQAIWVIESLKYYTQGTAFFLEDVGLITCAHSAKPSSIIIKPDDFYKEYKVSVKNKNDDLDIALINLEEDIEKSKKIFLKRGNSDLINVEDEIKLLGCPDYSKGKSVQVYNGRITGTRMFMDNKLFVLDIPIYGGSSGGPVLNKNNEVIAIAVAGRVNKEYDKTQENFALRINEIEKCDFINFRNESIT